MARLVGGRPPAEERRMPVPDDLWSTDSERGEGPLAAYHVVDGLLEEAEATLRRLTTDDEGQLAVLGVAAQPLAPAAVAVLRGMADRAAGLRTELGQVVDRPRPGEIRWATVGPRSVALRVSPVEVGPKLETSFDAFPGALIFTSATLTTGHEGSFGFVRERLGLGDAADEATFPSPFRYSQQALLYLAADLPEPSDERFADAASTRLLELCTLSRGRALLLFTSFRNMFLAAARFRKESKFPLLVQGEAPRHVLLERLRAQTGSVLLATQSFWEGVDVPGEALSLVAMDRLPFAVPDDPLIAARITTLREAGADPFGAFQLPQAALALKQGFGRLIRTRRDRGVVALLDPRVLHKTYGATLLESLPKDCPRTELLEDVGAFFSA